VAADGPPLAQKVLNAIMIAVGVGLCFITYFRGDGVLVAAVGSIGILLILSGYVLYRRLSAASFISSFIVLLAPGAGGPAAVFSCLLMAVLCVLIAEGMGHGSPIPNTMEPGATSAGAGKTNVLAILALVFGLLGGIAAIPLGHIGLYQIRRTGEAGRGMAIAGLVLGYSVVGLFVIYVTVLTVLSAQVG
jgi:hypothetical protein